MLSKAPPLLTSGWNSAVGTERGVLHEDVHIDHGLASAGPHEAGA